MAFRGDIFATGRGAGRGFQATRVLKKRSPFQGVPIFAWGCFRDFLSDPKKVDPPGGTTGRVGCGTGVDEAPVPDAGSTREALSVEVIGLLEETASQIKVRSISVIAGAHAADVVAVSVELANKAAAAIAVLVVTVIAGGDR